MNRIRNNKGFSLTEMLIATGIMAIGLVLIATIFPVAIKLTGLSAERSVAVVAADEAFAKVRLYGLRDFQYWPVADPNTGCTDFMFLANLDQNNDGVVNASDDLNLVWPEFLYPSTTVPTGEEYRYHWSALFRRAGDKDVQVTVFVTSKTFAGMKYYGYFYNGTNYTAANTGIWPMPIPVNVQYDPTKTSVTRLKELEILADVDNLNWGTGPSGIPLVYSFFDEGYKIVNNRDGKIYRILEMKDADNDALHTRETIVLYENWQWDGYDSDPLNPPTTVQSETVWVVPPGVGSSRYPCVGIFPTTIYFDNIQ